MDVVSCTISTEEKHVCTLFQKDSVPVLSACIALWISTLTVSLSSNK